MPRRRLHREFLRWLKLNGVRLVIGIALIKRTDEVLEFGFVGINPAITGYLSTKDINVDVTFDDKDFDDDTWDTLLWLFHGAKPVPGGYICSECKPEYKKVFPGLVALWTDHLFEALLTWINEELAPARWLILEGRIRRYTSARISPLRPDGPTAPDLVLHVLPLRTPLRKETDTSPSVSLHPLPLADRTDGRGLPPSSLP
jgi:hypothetical protein